MPKTVNHNERRSMILEAFVAVAVREGLHAVSMRTVAAEAEISLRLVQYYFENKARLMREGLMALERMSNERWANHASTSTEALTVTETLEALFTVALPTDSHGREFHLLWMSYAVLSMTDPEIPNEALLDGPNRLLQRVTLLLKQGQESGEFGNELDATAEAIILLGLIHGLGTAVMTGMQSGKVALELLTLHLGRLKRSKTQQSIK